METTLEATLKFVKGESFNAVSGSAQTGDFIPWILLALTIIALIAAAILLKKKKTSMTLFAVIGILCLCALPVGLANASVTSNNILATVETDGTIKIDSLKVDNTNDGLAKIKSIQLNEINNTNKAEFTIGSFKLQANSQAQSADIDVAAKSNVQLPVTTNMDKDTAFSLFDKDAVNIRLTIFEYAPDRTKYEGNFSKETGGLAGTDALGRKLVTDNNTYLQATNKHVGVFYFQWLGQHGSDNIYDNNVIGKKPGATESVENWIANGGGAGGATHFWGKPLFDYYTTDDEWVYRKHCQMLVDAGIDYIILDTTNGYIYKEQFEKLLKVWIEYYKKGYNVPKIAFYTNTTSVKAMSLLYSEIYTNVEFNSKYPEVADLWYKIDDAPNKPLMIGKNDATESDTNDLKVTTIYNEELDLNNASNVSYDTLKEYFNLKNSQWPNEEKKENSWPWIEFDRYMKGACIHTDLNGKEMVMNITPAQHQSTERFSFTAWYGDNDRTRSWNGTQNDPSPDAYKYGYNYALQWNWMLNNHPDVANIFITGWNEWGAQRMETTGVANKPIGFVDCVTPNCSRDIEPMENELKDNYYMQTINFIRQYKGVRDRVDVGDKTHIDINGSFDQWDNNKITAIYKDYTNDIVDRNGRAFGNVYLTNTTGRNDIAMTKATRDDNNIYFYLECTDTMKGDKNKNVLFLNTREGEANWEGYSYAVNLHGDGVISKCNGGWDWTDIGKVEYKLDGNKIMLAIPNSSLGFNKYNDGLINLEFKWADNFQGEGDVMSFYKDGDAAPYGRLNYVFSNVA